jgi:hypothetical protein
MIQLINLALDATIYTYILNIKLFLKLLWQQPFLIISAAVDIAC